MMGIKKEVPKVDAFYDQEDEDKKKAQEAKEKLNEMMFEQEKMKKRKADQMEFQRKLDNLNNKDQILESYKNDPQLKIPKNLFKEYLIAEGCDRNEENIIDSIFDAYCEKPDKKTTAVGMNYNNPQPAKDLDELKISLETFLFNYGRYLGDKLKKKDLVSVKKSKEFNKLLRTYLNEWKANYPKFFLHKLSKPNEQLKKDAMFGMIPNEIYLQMSRKDLETFHYKKLLTEHKSVEDLLKEFNNCPFNTTGLQKRFKELCGDMPKNYKRKKVICNFLVENMPPLENVQLEDLLYSMDNKVQDRADYLEKMGNLLHNYKKTKVQFKEDTFTLFDIANYIYNELGNEEDNQLMFYLIAKFKKHKNKKFKRAYDAEIDPRKPFEVKELDETFAYICTKSEDEIGIMSQFLEKVEAFEGIYHHDSHNKKVEQAVKDNLVVKYI